jgi:hypothetical protein
LREQVEVRVHKPTDERPDHGAQQRETCGPRAYPDEHQPADRAADDPVSCDGSLDLERRGAQHPMS